MDWNDFLQEIAEDKRVNLIGRSRECFMETHRCPSLEKFQGRTISTLAKELGYTNETSYRQSMVKVYEALAPLLQEDGIDLGKGRGRTTGTESKPYRVHRWLVQRHRKRCSKQEIEQQAIQSIEKLEYKLHVQLKGLNYFSEEGLFQSEVSRRGACSAFLIRVDGEDAQAWLARRLAEKIRNFQEADRVAINLKNRYLSADLGELWRKLSKQPEPFPITDADRSRIIEEIAARCQTKTMIIALYGVRRLEEESWRCLENNFWLPLTQQLNRQSSFGKCILLLTERANFSCTSLMSGICELAAWETLREEDWQYWIGDEAVRKLWGINPPLDPVFERIYSHKLQEVLENICRQLKIKDESLEGIDVMRHKIWNLGAA